MLPRLDAVWLGLLRKGQKRLAVILVIKTSSPSAMEVKGLETEQMNSWYTVFFLSPPTCFERKQKWHLIIKTVQIRSSKGICWQKEIKKKGEETKRKRWKRNFRLVAALQPLYSLYFRYHIQNAHFHTVKALQTSLISNTQMMPFEPILMFSLATATSHTQQLSSKVPLNYIVGQIKTCTSDHSPRVSLWDHIHKGNKKHLLLHTSLWEFAWCLSNTGDECLWSRANAGASSQWRNGGGCAS